MTSNDTPKVPSRPRLRQACALLQILGLLLSSPAWAEGSIRTLACTASQACDAAGICEMSTEQVTFRMEPLALDPDGSGEFELSYGDNQVRMEALTAAGPFFWVNGNERNALLAGSETEFLWHSLVIEPVPEASIRFLSCTLSQ